MHRQIKQVASGNEVRRLLNVWPAQLDAFVADVRTIQQIPAPTFFEEQRAHFVEARFKAIGLADVFRDELNNVYGRTPASTSRTSASPAVMVSAHMDTVFPATTDLTLRDKGEYGRIFGPGVGDNSLGVAAMLSLAAELQNRNILLQNDIWWVATVCEEGLGDLKGIRQACKTLKDLLGVAVILEGIGLGRVYHAGLGARRLQISAEGPGGHSWLHAKRPSAIHQLMRLGHAILTEIDVPTHPRSSLNIGLISGGTSINSRAADASMSIDIRSIDRAKLEQMLDGLHTLVSRYATPTVKISVKVVGNRPSATLSLSHPMIKATRTVLNYVGCASSQPEIGSTDANIPLSLKIPTVCIGITTGGNAHTTDEYINISPIPLGMRQLSLLTVLAATYTEQWQAWETESGG